MVKLTNEYRRLLHDIYFSSKEGGFSSVQTVYRVAKRKSPSITRAIVQEYLNQIESSVLHRKALRKHVTRSFLQVAPFDTFAADLFFFSGPQGPRKKQGRPIGALQVLDSISKNMWCRQLATKSAKNVLSAFQNVIDTLKRSPKNLFCDKVSLHSVFDEIILRLSLSSFFSLLLLLLSSLLST